ncbi:6948_t:CDS:2, partial [Gigaspora rosea]
LNLPKEFKTNRGFSRHNNTIRKLNKLSVEQKKIPVSIIAKIKGDIVYSIHRRLGKNSKNTGVSRCIFRGSIGYQELSNILNDQHPLIRRAKEEAAIAKAKNSKNKFEN